ncbi:MAG: DUF3089 domain-containing protein [Nitrospirae bacterium]|nr:DUF3089 domain-containing protein [Nitrospirota bacterium]
MKDIVARMDTRVSSAADSKGNKIALTGQTPSAYFLDSILSTCKNELKRIRRNDRKKQSVINCALLVSFTLAACGNDNSAPQATDYSQAAHWLSLPAVTEPVDVFYLYPTAWENSDPNPQISAIDEPSMLILATLAFERQATAFETAGNVFAPSYRQDNNSPVDRLNVIAGIPTLDAVAAFDYYIKHFNKGRPFILVGHSQGATVLSNLLSGYMKDHPDVLSKMVAAYVIGHPVTDAYLTANPHLHFAAGPDDTGGIISYNTALPWLMGPIPSYMVWWGVS